MATKTAAKWAALFEEAHAAGMAAGEAATPPMMLVGTPRNLLGSLMGGDDGGFDPDQPVYAVPQGPCGFAWITIRPATGSFARWAKAAGKGSAGTYGGLTIRVRAFGQSLVRKEAYAAAFAGVLTKAGITAYPESRMD